MGRSLRRGSSYSWVVLLRCPLIIQAAAADQCAYKVITIKWLLSFNFVHYHWALTTQVTQVRQSSSYRCLASSTWIAKNIYNAFTQAEQGQHSHFSHLQLTASKREHSWLYWLYLQLSLSSYSIKGYVIYHPEVPEFRFQHYYSVVWMSNPSWYNRVLIR